MATEESIPDLVQSRVRDKFPSATWFVMIDRHLITVLLAPNRPALR